MVSKRKNEIEKITFAWMGYIGCQGNIKDDSLIYAYRHADNARTNDVTRISQDT
jgi:hypothetical protein